MNTASPEPRFVALPTLDDEVLRKTATTTSIWNDSRRHARSKVQAKATLVLEPTYATAGREMQSQEVYLRDLSRSGMRFVHGALLFPGEFAQLTLPTGTSYRLEVVWCRRIAPGIFMSGSQFVTATK